MDFNEVVEKSKEARVYVQDSPVPFMPPGLILTFADQEPRASALCFQPTEQNLTGMLALVPALQAHGLFLTFEAYVRPEGTGSDGLISEDPMSQPALINIGATREGEVEVRLNPYTVNDQGFLVWSTTIGWESPAVPKLLAAMKELFTIEIEGKHVAAEVCNWLAINGYALQVDPMLLPEEDRPKNG